MRKLFVCLALVAVSAAVTAQDLKVMTFNIRLNTSSDSANAWPYRKDHLASQVLYHQAVILGVQEALHDQMLDLQQRLPQYKHVGGGREDGKEKGEYSAIFYDSTRLQLLQSKTFWLSETPDVVGKKGWDAALPRIVTWAKFKDRKTGKQFYAFNTHFDHMGKVARRESAKLLLQQVKAISGKLPAVVTGDFNATPDDEPIQVILDPADPLHLTDSKAISATPHYGPTGTFNGFKKSETTDQPIDYIFLKEKWKVLDHATISQTWQGRFASDHFSVIATLRL